MKKISALLLSGILFISINSCKKDPLSCASADKNTALTDEAIAFSSCSENSVRVAWDFGDGSLDEGNEVSHSYEKAGTYLVKMTAYSKKDKDWDRTSLIVTISDPPVPPPPTKRYLTKIVLKNFPAQNGGSDWDGVVEYPSGSEPDIYVEIKLASGEWSINTSSNLIDDATVAGNLPHTWGFTPDNIYLVNQNWEINLIDKDAGTLSPPFELMHSWAGINLATYTATNGMISLSYGTSPNNYVLEIYFDER